MDVTPPSRRITIILLVALLVAHVGLAIWFANVTPYRTSGILRSYGKSPAKDIGAPDERQHVNYVARLVKGEGFPVFNPTDPNLYESYQSHQPPAFYVASSAWAKIVGFTDEESPNGILLRYLNAIVGALGVAGVFFLGRWGFGHNDVGLIASSFAALMPMNVALSGAVSNDPMLIALCTWVLALVALAVRTEWTMKIAVGVGVLTGIALLTKTTAISLLPVLLLAILFRKPKPAQALTAIAIIGALAIPWWIRNNSLYGDPLAMKAFSQAFVGSAQAKTFIDEAGLPGYLISWVGWFTARSFFGAFGYMDIWMNENGTAMSNTPNTIYRILLAGMFVLVVAWIASLKRPEFKDAKNVQILNGVFLAIVVLLFVRFNLQYFQGQARYIYPAIGPISIGVSLGLLTLYKNRWQYGLATLCTILFALSCYAGFRLPAEFMKRVDPVNTSSSG